MARKRTRKALEELWGALDPDGDPDPGLAELPHEVRERLMDAVEETLRAVFARPVVDGRGRPGKNDTKWWPAFTYIRDNPPPLPLGSHFIYKERTKGKKGEELLEAVSEWAGPYVKYMEDHGASRESARYLFNEITQRENAPSAYDPSAHDERELDAQDEHSMTQAELAAVFRKKKPAAD